MIQQDDFIFVNDWPSVCPMEVLCGATEGVTDLFAAAETSGRPRVLLTSASDLALTEQALEHPNEDLTKMAVATPWLEASAVRDRYVGFRVGPCCEEKKCDASHFFSLKTERFTWQTFDSIPTNVGTWFTTNANVVHPKVKLIPFGLNDHGPGASMLPGFQGRGKRSLLYVNFQDNTLERVYLKRHYVSHPWLTFQPRADVPVGTYLQEMSEHAFVLSPAGNGPDCYRVWESIYLGCFPILSESPFSRQLAALGLPVVVVPDLFSLTRSFLEKKLDEMSGIEFDLRAARKSYWSEEINREVRKWA